jgi:hypothetical protein
MWCTWFTPCPSTSSSSSSSYNYYYFYFSCNHMHHLTTYHSVAYASREDAERIVTAFHQSGNIFRHGDIVHLHTKELMDALERVSVCRPMPCLHA